MALIQTATPVAGTGSSVTITFPGSTAVTSGNSIILKFYKASDAVSITSVEDNTATALTLDLSTSLDTDNNGRFYSLHNITDGPVSVTVTFSGSVTYSVLMHEVSGITSTVVQTIAATADGEGFATDHSWEYTAANTDDFATFLGGAFTGFPTDTATGTGNTTVQQVDSFAVQCHEFAPGSGSQSATFTLTNFRENNYCGVVYAAGSGGGGGDPDLVVPSAPAQRNRRKSGRYL